MMNTTTRFPTSNRRMKILMVEDSEIIRDAITGMLAGYPNLEITHFAVSPKEAIDLLDQYTFDFMILDIELKRGNGFEVIHHIRRPEYALPAPITMMFTNHANSKYRRLASELKVDYFFDKSIDFDSAIGVIESEAEKFSVQN